MMPEQVAIKKNNLYPFFTQYSKLTQNVFNLNVSAKTVKPLEGKRY